MTRKNISYKEKEFGRYLKHLRESHDYKQDYISDLLGFDSYSSYGKYERGQSKLHIDQAIKLAELYGMTLDEFVTMSKALPGKVAEAATVYNRSESATLIVEIDGNEGKMNRAIEMIKKMNAVLAG